MGGQAGAAAAGGARRSSRLQTQMVSPIFSLKEELVGMIVRLGAALPAGLAEEQEGVVRLLGVGARAGRAMRLWPAMALQVLAKGGGGAGRGV